jgi:teichuronic acid exporter
MASLTQKTVFAANWRAFGVLAKFVLQGFSTIWLTRMLSVEAFGIYSEIWVYVALVQLLADLGLSSALIQKKTVQPEETAAALLFTGAWGAILSLVVLLLGYFLAGGMRFQVLLITAPTIALTGISSTASASLSRALDFKKIMWVEAASIFAGPCLTAILLGLAGFEATALAGGMLVQAVVRAILFFNVTEIKPGRQTLKDVRELLKFGRPMTLARLANYCALNGDYFVIGRRLGAYFLGIYSRAYTLMSLPIMETTSILSTVLFPAYSRLQDDPARLRAAYFRAMRLVTFLMIPMSVGMAISAPELVASLFGDKWISAVEPFAILCCGGWLRSISNLSDALARSKGAVKAQSARHIIYATLVISGAYVGCKWGLAGAATGVFVGIVVMAFLMGGLSLRILQSNWGEMLRAIMPGVLIAVMNVVICSIALRFLRDHSAPPVVRLAVSFLTQALLLGATFLIFNRKLLTSHERDIAQGMIRRIWPFRLGSDGKQKA